jgi:hypothetical protein
MRGTVFIQTNDRQHVVAEVSAYSLRRASRRPHAFDVQIMRREDHPFFDAKEGALYLRDGRRQEWRNDDLQSFTPLRFMPPSLMGYAGRALVIDPDIFAVGDVLELLERDMEGKAVLCRPSSGAKGRAGSMASSVMLLDCEKLPHWSCEQQFEQLFRFERDYSDWISLRDEPRDSIGPLEQEWNDFDRLTERTKLLHNTRRWTQPWKTGLPVDFSPSERTRRFPPLGWARRVRRRLLGPHLFAGRYRAHHDPRQEAFFFGLLRECVEQGVLPEERVREEMRRSHLREDALDLLDRAPPLNPAR